MLIIEHIEIRTKTFRISPQISDKKKHHHQQQQHYYFSHKSKYC